MYYSSDPCPRCGEKGLPPLGPPGSVATARRCQLCGHIQELDPATGKPVSGTSPRLEEGE